MPCLTPVVPIKFVKLDGTMTPATLGVVDSGCDSSTFPAEWARALGIDLHGADCVTQQGSTAGGVIKQHFYKPGLDILFLGRKIHLAAAFNPGLPVILLGRQDFFACFKITFDQRANAFTVESY